jgi:hypothetical protein
MRRIQCQYSGKRFDPQVKPLGGVSEYIARIEGMTYQTVTVQRTERTWVHNFGIDWTRQIVSEFCYIGCTGTDIMKF